MPEDKAAEFAQRGEVTYLDAAMSGPPVHRMMTPTSAQKKSEASSTRITSIFIVVPTYRRPKEIAANVRDILSLTLDFMLVVIDDGSGDDTLPTLGGIDDKRLLVLARGINSGPNVARMEAFKFIPDSPNVMVVELDDHDRLARDAISRMRTALDTGADLVYGDVQLKATAPGGEIVGSVLKKEPAYPGIFKYEGNQAYGVRAYRASAYHATGGYRADEFPAGEYALFLRMEALGYRARHIPEILSIVLRTPYSISARHREEQCRNATRFQERALAGSLVASVVCDEPEPPDFSDVTEKMIHAASAASVPRVSVIIPMFHSANYIWPCLQSIARAGTQAEIICVDDGCSSGSGLAAMEEMKRLGLSGLVIQLSRNVGFGPANNRGARYARGEYICLLNADTQVEAGWLDEMVRLAVEKKAGAVGNLHLYPDGSIQSIGSEYSYGVGGFEHVLKGSRDLGNPEVTNVVERDMMTAACLLVDRKLWDDLGGFDERYLHAYWEDTDLCMRIRSAGRRIFYCPTSRIVHAVGHSHATGNPKNKELFHRRWVRTGKVDIFARQRGRRMHSKDIVACYIVLNEEEFIQASLESIYEYVDRIVIVEGGTRFALSAGLCNADGSSIDGTVERIRAFPDPQGKITWERGLWADKAEERNAYIRHLKDGDWMWTVDGDEVFTREGIGEIFYNMHFHDAVYYWRYTFWNNLNTIATGIWDRFVPYSMMRFKAGTHFIDHTWPTGPDGEPLYHGQKDGLTIRKPLCHHYAYVGRDEKIRRKISYYEKQCNGRVRKNYFEDVYLAWRKDPVGITTRYGTHPFGGGEWSRFLGNHPAPIARRIASGEYDW